MPTANIIKSQFYAPNAITNEEELYHFETELDQIADMSSFMKTCNTEIESIDDLRRLLGVTTINVGSFPFIRQNNTLYQVGDTVCSEYLPSYLRLECIQAGTTGEIEPDYTVPHESRLGNTFREGTYINDGTVKWIVSSVFAPLAGTIIQSLFVPYGFVELNGATVNRNDYPRLVQLANEKELWTNDIENNPGLFGVGDLTTTMVLPNYSEHCFSSMIYCIKY